MSTIGSGTRSSAATQRVRKTAAPANRPSTRAEVQPQFSPSVKASSRKTSPADSSVAPTSVNTLAVIAFQPKRVTAIANR